MLAYSKFGQARTQNVDLFYANAKLFDRYRGCHACTLYAVRVIVCELLLSTCPLGIFWLLA